MSAVLDAPGADDLGDAASLGRHHVALADTVEQRRFAVIDVAHHRHHRGARHQVGFIAGRLGLRLEFLLHILRPLDLHLAAEIEGDGLGQVGIERGIDRHARRRPVIAELEEQFAGLDADRFGERADGDRHFQRHLADALDGAGPLNLFLEMDELLGAALVLVGDEEAAAAAAQLVLHLGLAFRGPLVARGVAFVAAGDGAAFALRGFPFFGVLVGDFWGRRQRHALDDLLGLLGGDLAGQAGQRLLDRLRLFRLDLRQRLEGLQRRLHAHHRRPNLPVASRPRSAVATGPSSRQIGHAGPAEILHLSADFRQRRRSSRRRGRGRRGPGGGRHLGRCRSRRRGRLRRRRRRRRGLLWRLRTRGFCGRGRHGRLDLRFALGFRRRRGSGWLRGFDGSRRRSRLRLTRSRARRRQHPDARVEVRRQWRRHRRRRHGDRRPAPSPLHHLLDRISLLRVETAQLIFHVVSGLAAHVEQILGLHVQFARQFVDTDFIF